MTLDEFRIAHSQLIEHYQHIEFNLKGILASITDGVRFLTGMEDVERDSIKRLIKEIKDKQENKDITILTEEECDQLRQISDRRNYWCHQCYIEMVFDYATGAPKKMYQIDEFLRDIKEAEQMRDHLFEKKLPLLEEKMKTEIKGEPRTLF